MERPHTLEVPGYQVVQYLGRGARSSIWEIRDIATGHRYALKRVVKRHPSDARYLDQALAEYEIGEKLHHPVIRRIHTLRRVKKWLALREIHLVMELCQGTTIQESRPKSVLRIVEIFTAVADGLAYMNGQGFIHADMKPNNIVVGSDDTVKVIDLGQSCVTGTVKERIQGTPDFIAPEQVQRKPLDGRTDVYNYGAALYWALAGEPIPTLMPKAKGLRTSEGLQAKPIEELNPDVPTGLARMIADCIEMQPSRRPQSMNDVLSRMQTILHVMERNGGSGSRPAVADDDGDPAVEHRPASQAQDTPVLDDDELAALHEELEKAPEEQENE